MTTQSSKAIDEAQIRAQIDDWAKAIRAKDINARMSNYAPDVLLFDVVNPLQYIGSDAIRKRAAEWFASFQGSLGYEVRDLRITVDGSVAFSHCLNRVFGKKTDGQELDMWWRATAGYRKMSSKWMVTHEHASVPFNVENGKASLDLKP